MVFTETNEYPKNLAHNPVQKELQSKDRRSEVNPDARETHKM